MDHFIAQWHPHCCYNGGMGKFVIISILLSFSAVAGQKSDDRADQEVKRTHIKMEIQKQKIDREFQSGDAVDENTTFVPETSNTVDVSPVEWGEQQESLKTEPMVQTYDSDHTSGIEQDVYKQQQIERDRAKYRQAIQRQFDDNLDAAGVSTRRNIAEEIRRLEELQKASKAQK